MTELTFAILKYGFLILLWVFAFLAVRSLHRDVETMSPRPSRARRHKERRARKAAEERPTTPVRPLESEAAHAPRPETAPTLLVIIDGPLAGTSVPLSGDTVTLGRSASNTVVLDDEFVSSHHARIYRDPATGQWAIEDLGSTNGTIVDHRRLETPTVLPARVPVRIGATTFELR